MQSAVPAHPDLPFRTDRDAPPPAELALPGPGESPWLHTSMPLIRRGRPLKRWRYVGVYGERLMVCVGDVHIGPARQTFWAVWDREREQLLERTSLIGGGGVVLEPGRARVNDVRRGVAIDIRLDELPGVVSVCPSGAGYVWTRKQGGVEADAEVALPGAGRVSVTAHAVVDDTAGYHARDTNWLWSAGVGTTTAGERVAWNLVTGVNDPPNGSERSVWVDGVAREVGPVQFDPGLAGVRFDDGEELSFSPEAVRRRRDNLLLVRSDYEQPFGTFRGTLPGGLRLERGYGVIERHAARW